MGILVDREMAFNYYQANLANGLVTGVALDVSKGVLYSDQTTFLLHAERSEYI